MANVNILDFKDRWVLDTPVTSDNVPQRPVSYMNEPQLPARSEASKSIIPFIAWFFGGVLLYVLHMVTDIFVY